MTETQILARLMQRGYRVWAGGGPTWEQMGPKEREPWLAVAEAVIAAGRSPLGVPEPVYVEGRESR